MLVAKSQFGGIVLIFYDVVGNVRSGVEDQAEHHALKEAAMGSVDDRFPLEASLSKVEVV